MNDVKELLTFAVNNGATQVLMSVGSPPILRKEEKLIFAKMAPLSPDDTRRLVYSALTPNQIEILENERELSFTYYLNEDRRCLGSAYFERGCLSGVFRIVPSAAALPAKLGLPSILAEAAGASRGLVIVAAPAGHGKSTALASLVEFINTEREATVLTVEERIVYPHANRKSVIHQREVGRDTLSFLSALEAAARQDPDVLVVDPMNEGEVIRRVPALAGRGNLVIASIEAEYVMEALGKMLKAAAEKDGESARRQLGASLTLVAAIRLLGRKDGAGRVPVTEVLKVDADVAQLIRAGDTEALAERMSSPEETGTWTMDSYILKLHERGLIDDETAGRHLLDPGLLES